MAWIKPIPYSESEGKLRELYDRIKGPDDYLDNILTIHGLRPHTLEGHMTLYKNTLHHFANTLEKWRLEFLGTYTSKLNACDYCVNHHFAGLKTLLNNDELAECYWQAIQNDDFSDLSDEKQESLLCYAKALTLKPGAVPSELIDQMRAQGLDDGEILEVNQLIAYFNYANRTVLGLGVSNEGEILGLSPSDNRDPDDWAHNQAKE